MLRRKGSLGLLAVLVCGETRFIGACSLPGLQEGRSSFSFPMIYPIFIVSTDELILLTMYDMKRMLPEFLAFYHGARHATAWVSLRLHGVVYPIPPHQRVELTT